MRCVLWILKGPVVVRPNLYYTSDIVEASHGIRSRAHYVQLCLSISLHSETIYMYSLHSQAHFSPFSTFQFLKILRPSRLKLRGTNAACRNISRSRPLLWMLRRNATGLLVNIDHLLRRRRVEGHHLLTPRRGHCAGVVLHIRICEHICHARKKQTTYIASLSADALLLINRPRPLLSLPEGLADLPTDRLVRSQRLLA